MDFDKTKPYIQKQFEEVFPETLSKKTQNLTKDQQKKMGTPTHINVSITNGKSKSATRKVDSYSSIIKKRQTKAPDPDTNKYETTPKSLNKKYKRDSS